ncbi:hypothetical protein C9374_000486 [Naegleria lovaniensis]|uniref:Transmembrane protein n=1 Tax=Naegleria lovaniensis TaxID=51637 RepID=A0AA88GWI1_NAELO|nr:uncharacterized protein C9374_000486 [Naegleria lovaniensis]KAG2388322.1 hypothetical protein C9374_000486 [Naegleria lovaniensis]
MAKRFSAFSVHLSLVFCFFLFAMTLNTVHAQQCLNKKNAPFSPTPCSNCNFCSGLGSSPSCCTLADDVRIKDSVSIFDIVGGACVDVAKEMACSLCDPKNQKYIDTTTMEVKLCKSACVKLADTCKTGAARLCDALPTTDCWSAATSGLQVVWSLSVLLICVITFLM